MTINVLIKWCYRKKVLRNHEVHLTLIYHRIKFQSVGSAEFNTAYFHAWFYEVDGLVQEIRNSISNALELRLSCTTLTHRNENPFCTRTVMCHWWLVEQAVGQTLEWSVSLESIAYDSYISVDLHACETVLKYFPGFSPQFTADWLGYATIIYYHTNITVASHVHKITGNLTICSIVCSFKEKVKQTTQYWSFFRQIHRLSSLKDSKADSVPWYYNQQKLSAHLFQYSDYTWLFRTFENNMISKPLSF